MKKTITITEEVDCCDICESVLNGDGYGWDICQSCKKHICNNCLREHEIFYERGKSINLIICKHCTNSENITAIKIKNILSAHENLIELIKDFEDPRVLMSEKQ